MRKDVIQNFIKNIKVKVTKYGFFPPVFENFWGKVESKHIFCLLF